MEQVLTNHYRSVRAMNSVDELGSYSDLGFKVGNARRQLGKSSKGDDDDDSKGSKGGKGGYYYGRRDLNSDTDSHRRLKGSKGDDDYVSKGSKGCKGSKGGKGSKGCKGSKGGKGGYYDDYYDMRQLNIDGSSRRRLKGGKGDDDDESKGSKGNK